MWINHMEDCENSLKAEGEAYEKATEILKNTVHELVKFLEEHKLCPYSGETLPERCKKRLIGM